MQQTVKIGIYGDSLMKATMPDNNWRYHFHAELLTSAFSKLPVSLTNRAKFGATTCKGSFVLQQDMAAGRSYDYALIEFGGNDCNYDWISIAADPEGTHSPAVSLPQFTAGLEDMVQTLEQQQIQPVLMTLPPIDANRYLDFIVSKGSSKPAILHWLGDVQRIYRVQELYSNAIANLAQRFQLPCIDVRSLFLASPRFSQLISRDGIHPSESGYHLLYQTLAGFLRTALSIPHLA
ncbi:MAG: SGNH/GDSL hydrolase family protein [Oscillospiraceae bacterium]|jgi:acyl-CoA thioesterase-1